MTPTLIALVTLRSLSAVVATQGKPEIGNALAAVIAAYEAGKNVDAHMQEIADKLRDDVPLDDWDTLTTRIDAETQKFLGGD